MSHKRILCVGLACVDIINICHNYPEEDVKQRVIDQRSQRGGNASNSCTVLSCLQVPCEWMGTIAEAPEMQFLLDSFKTWNIPIMNAKYHSNCKTPLGVVLINKENGSRTILYCKEDLPEVTLDDFKKIDFTCNEYLWVHFEGRPNIPQIKLMLAHIEKYNKSVDDDYRITVSVELEHNRPELEELLSLADYVFISKDHAKFSGCSNMKETVDNFIQRTREGSTVICAWGEDGAMAKTWDGRVCSSPCFPPKRVVDTLGAGDTFLATCIASLSKGMDLEEAIIKGCKVAGAKCGMGGFEELKSWCDECLPK